MVVNATFNNISVIAYLNLIEKFTVRYLGWSRFMKRHNLNKEPVVLCPAASHYSFLRDVFMIGLGEENLMIIQIAANTSMNMDNLTTSSISTFSKFHKDTSGMACNEFVAGMYI
jgi:hypothetical protein